MVFSCSGRVFIHPASVNFSCGSFPSGWMVYTDITETSKVYVREASMVPVYAVLLFGGKLSVHHVDGLIKIDGWATFRAPAQIAALVSYPYVLILGVIECIKAMNCCLSTTCWQTVNFAGKDVFVQGNGV